MTTIDTRPEAGDAAAPQIAGASAAVVGIAEWAGTTDHKRIGRLFVGFGLLELIGVALLGVVFGIERASDSVSNFNEDALLQLVQAYRTGLVFAVAAPIAIGLAIAVAPLQVGARLIAFPRVALAGFYTWLGGVLLTFGSLAGNGGVGGGEPDMVDLYLAGHGLMIIGLLAAAGSVATTILSARAPGMTMRRMPLFSWASLIGLLGMLIVLPVAFGNIVYLFVDQRIGAGLSFGGPEAATAWLGFVWSTPTILVFLLPAFGVFAEQVPVAFGERQAMRGVKFAGIALIGVVALAAATQQWSFDVSFDADQSFGDFLGDLLPFLAFNGLPLLGLLVAGAAAGLTIKNGVAGGRPTPNAAFLFGLLAVSLAALALLGNAAMSVVDLELAGTTFEEGIVVLATYAGVIGAMGGLVFWAPKLWGRTLADAKVAGVALLAALGAVLAGGAMLIAGAIGQPGGIPNNDTAVFAMLDLGDSAPIWNVLGLAGHALFALSVIALIGLMLQTFTGDGPDADENPYDAHTLEWTTLSPAPADNYEYLATVASAEPAFDRSAAALDDGTDGTEGNES